MIQPLVGIQQVARVLNRYFDTRVDNLASFDTGQMSRVFSFSVADEGYIVRFVSKNTAESIEKDHFISERLASSAVPVPPVIHSGISGDLHYAIAPRMPGIPLHGEHGEDDWPVVSQLIETLDAIHQTDISDAAGYGDFDGQGRGRSPGWREALLRVANEAAPDSFYGAWHRLFDDTFLDRAFFDRVYEEMKTLLKFCPEKRFLVHGDYAYSNVLVHDGKITAVLDWANAMYGDFLYDVAWMDLGSPELDYRARFKQFYRERGRSIDHYEERLLCYQCFISLDAQRWYAKSSQPVQYAWMRKRTLHLLERGPDGM